MNIVKFYRTIHFLSVEDLAKISGVPFYRIVAIEDGSKAKDEEYKAIAKAFGMSVNEMLGSSVGNTVERYLRSRLAVGHLNGVPEADVLKDLGLSERQLRKRVQQERIGGALICNEYDEHGYYIADTAEEKQRFLRRHMGVIRTLSRECKAFRDDLKASGEIPRA